MTAKNTKPTAELCPITELCMLCDASYAADDAREVENHRHPEPQSGVPRKQWLASKSSYDIWVVGTPEGRAWFLEKPERRRPAAFGDDDGAGIWATLLGAVQKAEKLIAVAKNRYGLDS